MVAQSFFKIFLAAPILLGFMAIGYSSFKLSFSGCLSNQKLTFLPLFLSSLSVWKRKLPYRASEIDLDTGRKSWLTVEGESILVRPFRSRKEKLSLTTFLFLLFCRDGRLPSREEARSFPHSTLPNAFHQFLVTFLSPFPFLRLGLF